MRCARGGSPGAWDRCATLRSCRTCEARLADDAAGMVREAAAQALGLIGSRKAETALEKAAAADGKSKVRKAPRAALDHIRARRT